LQQIKRARDNSTAAMCLSLVCTGIMRHEKGIILPSGKLKGLSHDIYLQFQLGVPGKVKKPEGQENEFIQWTMHIGNP